MDSEVDHIDLYSGTPGSEVYAGSIDPKSAEDLLNNGPADIMKPSYDDYVAVFDGPVVSQTEKSETSLEELDSVLAALEDRVDAIAEVLKVHGIHVE